MEPLAAQKVEVLACGGRIRDSDVALGAQGQEPLEASAGVLGPLSLVAVRQEEGQAAMSAATWPARR